MILIIDCYSNLNKCLPHRLIRQEASVSFIFQLSPAKWNPTTLQMWSSCLATRASRATMASTFVDLQGPTSSFKLSAE